MLAYCGMRVIAAPLLVDMVEDWSRVRSPSRARRRLRQGHPQNIVLRAVPRREALNVSGALYMHPDLIAELEAKMEREIVQPLPRAFAFNYADAMARMTPLSPSPRPFLFGTPW